MSGEKFPWKKVNNVGLEQMVVVQRECAPAVAILHILIAHMGEDRAVIASHDSLTDKTGFSKASIKRGIAYLRDNGLAEVLKLEKRASSTLFIVNRRIAWCGEAGRRSATVRAVAMVREQDQDEIGEEELTYIDVVELGADPRPEDWERRRKRLAAE